MSLKAQITADMKTAMKEKQVERLGTIRLLLAAMKQREVDERIELSDADIAAIIEKMVKQRKDSISQFEAAQRLDLADKEKAELVVLADYMPQQLTSDEIAVYLDEAIATHGSTPASMGKIMGDLKPKLAGRADMAEVSKLIKARLA
ncbi:GatB/YqeY domain-containing protein [Chitinibacter bivalviorum]|uniref:GatB/YqeY domain-containing protein n=1 Tax=Chitinibacter bivalviorum TaxID=2739434 RepID=A0A7H9BIR2_9NEIS|nr:GatB/YqeY domain-containing protein [Chitinibacter bivalviorum]QLG88186.1 GatB/YqeY domain-containing protein [Chitinibacter bivalviorum]